MLRAIILDIDGTLVDSEPCHEEAWNAVFRDKGIDQPGAELYGPFLARTEAEFVRHVAAVYPGIGSPEAVLELKNRYFARIASGLGVSYVFPGVVERLDDWRSRGIALAAATNGDRHDVYFSLMNTGLHAYFDVLAMADEVPAGKPDPGVYALAARRLGVEPARCGAAEDAPLGVRAARRAGCLTAAVAHRRDPRELEKALAEHAAEGDPGGALFGDTASALAWLDGHVSGCR